MQAILVQGGCAIDYTPVAAKVAGEVFVDNGKVLVFPQAVAAGALAAPYHSGIFDFVKDSSNISSVFTAVYWNASGDPYGGTAGTGCLTTTSSGNTWVGYALATAGTTTGTVRAILFDLPATLTLQGAVSKLIADPGNAGAIPVTTSGYCPIVTAGSETRTLAAPSFIGQELLLYIKTDGGTCVITVASAINQTGNNTITMADVRDVIRLVAIESGSSKVWHVVSNDGAALSTV